MINAIRSRWVSFGQVKVRLAIHLNLTRSNTGWFGHD
jgi:hypothetical protein